jgi:hypothetical protein
MAPQHDYVIANGSGSAVRSDLNNALAAIVSQNSGATEPTDKFAYMWWADTSAGVLKLRNAANNAWISLRELDGTLTIEAGSASTPGLYFTGDANTGIYSPGADQFAIATGGTSRVSVSTTALSSTLAVDHPLGAVGTPSITFTGDLNTGFWSPSADIIAASTGGAERLRIDSSGRFLVGTATARANFFDSTVSAVQQIEGAGTGPSRSSLAIINNSSVAGGSPYLVLAKSNSDTVGSNTISVDGEIQGLISFQGNDGSEFVEAARIAAEIDGTPGANDMPGRLVFSVTADAAATPTEAMRINNAGELLVGYTADNGAYKLQVNSQIFATSATVATSDGRYKENVATLGGCLDLVKALRPVSFTWKPQQDIICDEKLIREGHNFPDGTQVGFIAQEVQDALADKPWLGSVIKENTRPAINDDAGNELAPEEQFLGIAEGNLIAVLTNALQEAIAKIETLEAKVATLEAP